jgi:two-component system, sensor histidine kinase
MKINSNTMQKVLLVEDVSIARRAGAITLRELGFDADTAVNGQEAIDFAAQNQYTFILMDIGLPDMSGFEAAQTILQSKPDSKIIALTAHKTDIVQQQAKAAGMIGYILKPMTTDNLKEVESQFIAPCNQT